MYDIETGRFTTPDLLWAAFPSHTPYHYAYNSPLIFSDPSGLAPEKERDREKLMNIEWDGRVSATFTLLNNYNSEQAAFRIANQLFNWITCQQNWDLNQNGKRTGEAGAVYTGSSGEIKSDGSIEWTHHYVTTIPLSNGNKLKFNTDVHESAIPTGDCHESVMNAFIGGINDILKADARFFDNLYGRDISVVIMHSSLIFANGEAAPAKHKGYRGANKSEITLAGDILTGHTKVDDYRTSDRTAPHKNYMMIAHEFSHAIHFALTGDNFFSYDWQQQELFAITNTNRIQRFYGDPLRNTWSSIRPIWGLFYKST
ncbi:hypothetical protein MASR1M45_25280 [Candidatus Kapaibacterium sp.]